MSPDQIDTAIAEFRGWTEFSAPIEGSRRYGIRPDSAGEKYPFAAVPQYHRCLNAMREAEIILNTDDSHSYYWRLERELGWEYPSATAIQRAEALLRTIGKWQEPEKLSTHQAV